MTYSELAGKVYRMEKPTEEDYELADQIVRAIIRQSGRKDLLDSYQGSRAYGPIDDDNEPDMQDCD